MVLKIVEPGQTLDLIVEFHMPCEKKLVITEHDRLVIRDFIVSHFKIKMEKN